MDETTKWFTILFGLAEGVGGIMVLLLGIWLSTYRGGFAWSSDISKQFNWHPLLLCVGLIYLHANSILVYRAFRNSRKQNLKTAHTVVHVAAFILSLIGSKAVFDSHNLANPPIPNLYSLHSWIGLTAYIFFTCQWVAGFVIFFLPYAGIHLRSSYLHIHVFFGLMTFVLAVAAALLGLTEKALFSLPNYKDLPGEGALINIIGVLLIAFAALVVYLTTESMFKRQNIPEDENLLSRNGSTSSPSSIQ